MNPAEFEKLAARHNLVVIAEASWKGSGSLHNGWDSKLIRLLLLGCWLGRSCRSTTLSTVVEVAKNPAD